MKIKFKPLLLVTLLMVLTVLAVMPVNSYAKITKIKGKWTAPSICTCPWTLSPTNCTCFVFTPIE